MTKRVTILRSKIFDYWTNTDEGHNRVKAIRDQVGSYPSFVCADVDFPECFACGQPMRSRSKVKDRVKEWRDVWNKTSLERAHIIPHSKGGESTPSNLVLLCKDCHKENPDGISEEFFWRWLCTRPHYTQKRLSIIRQIPLSATQMNDLEEVMDEMHNGQLQDLIKKSWEKVNPVIVQGEASPGSIAEMIHHIADNCKQLEDPPKSEDQMELFNCKQLEDPPKSGDQLELFSYKQLKDPPKSGDQLELF